jgi:HlyD family secretion protein
MDDPQQLREQYSNSQESRRDASRGAVQPSHELVAAEEAKLPVPLPPSPSPRIRRWRRTLILLALLVICGAGAGVYLLKFSQPALPPGIVFGNGRLEADQINIDTKYAGRIVELFVDEGDLVKAAQVLARMDTRDLAASLKKAQAQVDQAQRAVDEANSNVTQQQSQVLLAQQEFDRATYLVQKGFQTKEVLDQRQQQLNSATALLNALKARVIQLEHALEAARHDVELYTVQIEDNTLIAPRDGRIQYRVANVGEVLPAGGHVFAMLDTSNVYMDIYLPAAQAGRVRFGADARIVLDAYPMVAIPAKVNFIASQAQFTPKTVETQSEREKLMFRIRVRIDPERLQTRAERVRSGLPGVGYVLIDPTTKWPDWLQRTPP